MTITQVQVNLAKNPQGVLAFCDIIIDDEFIVRGIVVCRDRDENLYIKMPSRKDRNGKFHDVAHPIRTDCQAYIEDEVIEAYEKAVNAYSRNGG